MSPSTPLHNGFRCILELILILSAYLDQLGARYYIPWLGRWTACDPLESKYAGMSPYNYGNCNPITFNDPNGMDGEKVTEPNPQYKSTTNTSSSKKSNNVIFTFEPETSLELKDTNNSNWTVITVRPMEEAASAIEKYVEKNGTIDNLAYIHHGSTYGYGIALKASYFKTIGDAINGELQKNQDKDPTDVIDKLLKTLVENNPDTKNYLQAAFSFYKVLNMVKPGGNYFSVGCNECYKDALAPKTLRH